MAGVAVALYDEASEPKSIAGSDRVLSWAPKSRIKNVEL